MSRILLVDDDPQALESTRKILELAEYEVVTASDGEAALARVRPSPERAPESFDLILTDVRMPKLGGLEFLRALHLCGERTPVILMTAYGRVEDAVWAMKMGAVDFLSKPFKRQALMSSVELALKRARPRGESSRPVVASAANDLSQFVGGSQSVAAVKRMIEQVAPTSATVLISGESGTGKELAARMLHSRSARAKAPFVALNCAAVPEQLMESELFGFEKGAFTGATIAKVGLFEAASGGTLMLDEIGDMPLTLQAKLLRALQEGEIRRVGATGSRKVDVRVIAASHKDLKELVSAGAFRADLLYRLEVITIGLPPLRDRVEDIPDLAYHFLRVSNERHGKSVSGIAEDAFEILLSHVWPGNIRELSNVIERAVIFAQGTEIVSADLPAHLVSIVSSRIPLFNASSTISVPIGTPLKDVEDLLIRKTLEATSGDKNMTAKLLGINSRTIYRKLGDKKLERESDVVAAPEISPEK
jgi:two-component system response regulator HydG